MFYSGVHSIILTSTSNLPQKLLQQNSNTCTSPNSYPNNNTLQTIQTETAPSVSLLQYFQLGGVLKKQFLVPAIHAEKLFSSDSVQILFHKILKVFYFQPGGDTQQQSNCKQSNYQPINSVILLVFTKSIDPGRSQCQGS